MLEFFAPPPPSAPSIQVEGAILEIGESLEATSSPVEGEDVETQESVQAIPTPLKGKGPEPKAHPQWPLLPQRRALVRKSSSVESGTRCQIATQRCIRQLECDQQFINEPTKQLLVELRVACQLNTSPSAELKSSNTKTNLIYKHAFCNYLLRVHVLLAFGVKCGVYKHAIILIPSDGLSGHTKYFHLRHCL